MSPEECLRDDRVQLLLKLQRIVYESAHEKIVLIIYPTSEGSGEPAYPCSLARVFAVRSHNIGD